MPLYLLHFSEPLGDPTRPRMMARHYLGFAEDERTREQRIAFHRRGQAGVSITTAAFKAGIEMHIGWLGEGTRDDERRMKRAGHHDARCAVCQAQKAASEPLAKSLEER